MKEKEEKRQNHANMVPEYKRQFSLKNAGFCHLCESEISNKDLLKAIGSHKV